MTILVGYGTTPHARRAVERAVEEAQLREVPLHVVAVVQHEEGDSPTRVRDEFAASEALEVELERLRERIVDDGVECRVAVVHARRGEVARELVEAAKTVGAELIVLGLRQRSPVGKLVMGSISQDVLLNAQSPVLTVKADVDE